MKESIFQGEVVASFKDADGWARKIPDFPIGRQHKGKSAHIRFNVDKPFDIFAFYKGIGFAIECKQIKKFRSLKIDDFRDSQIEALSEIADTQSALPYVFLNVRMKTPYENRLIIIHWTLLRDAFLKGPVSMDMLKKAPFYEGKKGLFPLKSFLQKRLEEFRV